MTEHTRSFIDTFTAEELESIEQHPYLPDEVYLAAKELALPVREVPDLYKGMYINQVYFFWATHPTAKTLPESLILDLHATTKLYMENYVTRNYHYFLNPRNITTLTYSKAPDFDPSEYSSKYPNKL